MWKRKSKGTCAETEYHELSAFLKRYGRQSLSHLLFLNDKQVYWTENRKACVIYRKIFNKLVVLGDPIGREDMITKAIFDFHMFADQQGCVPVYYQITKQYLDAYEALGYRSIKLGEEGIVDLPEFTLAGKKGAKLRTRRNKFERKGYQFTVIEPPYSNKMLTEMREVSDAWLDKRKEKSFSVGAFDEEYVSRFPVAMFRDPDGKLIAFATLAGRQNADKALTIDLMRSLPSSPHGTMDVLFVSIFQWSKDNDYSSCSLGVSPLSGVGEHQGAALYERLGRLVFLKGNFLYKFKGLREYKGKFAHRWESRYLAYKGSFFLIIVMQITMLIHTTPNHQDDKIPALTYLKRKIG